MNGALPGEDLIEAGIKNLHDGRETIEALLVAIGSPRLKRLGLNLPDPLPNNPEHLLYDLLAQDKPNSAHSRYNSLIRRLVSYERTAQCVSVTSSCLERFMRTLGSAVTNPARIFLVGGATAVLCGWRETTIDINLKIISESDEILRKLPALKERLQVNVELATPDHFIPFLPLWEDRSRFIQQEGKLTFLHYDFYAQALAKIERGYKADMLDVREMMKRGFIELDRLLDLFSEIESEIYKYPVLDAQEFRSVVERAIREMGAFPETNN